MNRTTDRLRLLADVLAEAEPTEFREVLLGETLRLVGRRRRFRRLRQTTAALVVLCLLGTLAWQFMMTGRGLVPPTVTSYTSVRTEPLPPGAIVRTRPLTADRIILSVASAAVVRTTPNSGKFRKVDDDELLALVAPRPAALVRVGPHSAKLVFVNPDDQKAFPLN